MAHVKKGDTVLVIAGKDKGVKGKVLSVIVGADKVIVEGVNRVVKHVKVGTTTRGATTGGLVHQEAPSTSPTSSWQRMSRRQRRRPRSPLQRRAPRQQPK